jgi:hypothetical protein
LVWAHQGKKIKTNFRIVKISCHKKNVMVFLGGQCPGSIWWYEKKNMKIF